MVVLSLTAFLLAVGLLYSPAAQAQQADKSPDNGTDPSRLSTTVAGSWEYADLNNEISIGLFDFSFTQPFTEKKDYSVRAKLPVMRVDFPGAGGYGIGDFSIKLTHVANLTQRYALVVGAEMVFDTAARPELGSGHNVAKVNLIYAKFLQNGAIFAPAVVQSNSLWGDDARADVNNTVFDFYYVPKLSDPNYFVTVDPAVSLDWESDKRFASLGVTVGRVLGPAFDGRDQVYLKPTVYVGDDRPGGWGLELGYKVIGF